MPPPVPVNHYVGFRKPLNLIWNRRHLQLFYAHSIQAAGAEPRHTLLACFEHSNLFKVNVPVRLDTGDERTRPTSTATGHTLPFKQGADGRSYKRSEGPEVSLYAQTEPPPAGHFADAPVNTAVER